MILDQTGFSLGATPGQQGEQRQFLLSSGWGGCHNESPSRVALGPGFSPLLGKYARSDVWPSEEKRRHAKSCHDGEVTIAVVRPLNHDRLFPPLARQVHAGTMVSEDQW